MSSKLRLAIPRFVAAVLAVVGSVSVASASPLAGNALAFNNGLGPAAGAWTGSTTFSQGTLQGRIDWAVFGPGVFPFAGYTPTAGEMTYTYQIYETGAAPLSSFAIALTDLADNIGTFTDADGGSAPTSSVLAPLASATWQFSGIPQGGNSKGLVFSSIRIPQNMFGVVIDTGQSSFVVPLPSPSPISIPEPASILAIGTCGLLLLGRRRNA